MIAMAQEMDLLDTGWTALRAFFTEGAPALDRAIDALERAQAGVRGLGDPSALTLWLLGVSIAFQYTRRPEPMETGLERARELVNLTARTQDEAITIPHRALVEAIYRDLADVVPAGASVYLATGLDYSDRTLRLARKAARAEWLAAAAASRADLLVRQAGGDRRAIRRAVALHEDARSRWSVRDPSGRAQAGLGYVDALLAVGEAGKAEVVSREALAVFAAHGDRFHEAAGHLHLARALFALDRDEALDAQAASISLYRMLGCRWELAQAERALD
ncbi:MAG: hypothetical protein ACT4P5_17605 [Armatimonadota bacterium]